MSGLLDRVVDFQMRHERLLSILFGTFFVVSTANYARFISLPDLPFITEEQLFWISAAWNALWYGFARPAILRRKEVRLAANPDEVQE